MKNIQIIQTRPEIFNGWVVKADTKRFGENAVMFEGSYEECWKYIKGIADMIGWKSVSVIVNGKRDKVNLWRVSVIYDLEDIFPKFFFPNFIHVSDIEKLHELIDC